MITVPKLLLQQVKDTHETLRQTTQDITAEQANWQPPGTALSIAAIWPHAIFTEDLTIQQICNSTELLATTTWQDKTGVSQVQPLSTDNWEKDYSEWAKAVTVEPAKLRDYMQAVFAATESYLEGLTDADFEREVDAAALGMGQRAIYSVISNGIVAHEDNIVGEISAIKGVQGLKGYPW